MGPAPEEEGGGLWSEMAVQAAQFDLSTSFLDLPDTLAYGLVRGAGNKILQQELTDKTRVAFYILGKGRWDSLLRLWINNKAITLPSSTTVHFHPGDDGEIGNGMTANSTGGDQHVDQFFTLVPGGLDPVTFSRYAWLALKVAPDPGAPTADLTVLADYQAMQVRQFDSSGNQTSFAWTQNWAWIICDFLINKFVLREGKINQPLVSAELARFDWASFSAAATYYDAVLSGGQKRFSDGGLVFLNSGDTAGKALEQMLLMCRSYLLERNGKFTLYADQARASVFTFTSDNVEAKSFKAYKRNLRAATNRLTPTFRDLSLASGSSDDATRFAIASDPQVNHEAHQRIAGARGAGLSVIPKITELALDLGVNTPERVWRILDAMLVRQLGDDVDANSVYNAPFSAEWIGYEDSLAVEPGDVVTIDPSISEEYGGKLFEVLECDENPDGTRGLRGLEYMPNAFPDAAPTQQALQAPTPGTGLPLSTSSAMIANPDLEAGDRDWTKEAGFSIVNDAANAYSGGWVAKFLGSSGAAFRNSILIAIQTGDVLLATAMIKRTGGDGSCHVRISWIASDGSTELSVTNGNDISSSSYAESRVVGTAPASAFFGRVESAVASMTVSTTAYFDRFNVALFPKNLDDVADGTTYARPLSTRISSGKPLIDFSEAIHLNKHLGNVPDDATSDRRAATANQKTGGDRGFTAIDSSNIIVAGGLDFTRSYTNKHLGNIPDGGSYFRVLEDLIANRPAAGTAGRLFHSTNEGVNGKWYRDTGSAWVQVGAGVVDDLAESTYGRPLASRLSSGKPLIDFSEAIHLNKSLDNVPDGTRAAWASTTQKNAAVDSSGNLLLKNVNDAVGTTSGPTTTSTTYAVIPEMTQTITFKGNKVLLVFTASMWSIDSPVNNVAIFKDGTQLSTDYEFDPGTAGSSALANHKLIVGITFIDSPSAASHTYDVRWKVGTSGKFFEAVGTARRFQIVELG